MKAMVLREPCEIATGEGPRKKAALPSKKNPLELADVPEPHPGPGELLVKVATCGVCHTEIDEIEDGGYAQYTVVPADFGGQSPLS
ncbi:MAG: hypothetical protein KKE57_00790 [Proteobacteria bacterium]|nr:hypothetical protein [Pseudomonadota bacterium]